MAQAPARSRVHGSPSKLAQDPYLYKSGCQILRAVVDLQVLHAGDYETANLDVPRLLQVGPESSFL